MTEKELKQWKAERAPWYHNPWVYILAFWVGVLWGFIELYNK